MPKDIRHNWAIVPLVPEGIYTDRQEQLEYFYNAAIKAITRRSMSTVLLGQRRMGKTEIFKRVVNRIFFEQSQPENLKQSVVPVYYSFSEQANDPWLFSIEYTENFLRWYTAFRLQDPFVLQKKNVKREHLSEFIQTRIGVSQGLQLGLNHLAYLQDKDVTIPAKETLLLPREVSDWDGSTIAVFLDEFQNTRLPQYDFDIVGFMQEAVESPTCPHFVTGSAMSMLGQEILGRGALFGRFRSTTIEGMTEYWGAELANKLANYYQADIAEDMFAVLSTRCAGNPFYITALVLQASEQGKAITDEQSLDEILAVDLASGFIWGELSDQVHRWIERINEYGISKWILYLAALEEEEKIDLERIQRQLRDKQGSFVELEKIRDILVKLSRGDLLEHLDLGGWFRKLKDPILADFLRAWGKVIVEGQDQRFVAAELVKSYQKQHKVILDHKGYLAEVYMAQVLWNLQGKTVPGEFFHQKQAVQVPDYFFYIRHRVRLGAGKGQEIDIYASAGTKVWIGESKWWSSRQAGVLEIEEFWNKRAMTLDFEGSDLLSVHLWFFSHAGFRPEAREKMTELGILWSDKDDLNMLLDLAGLRRLPVL